VTGDVATSATTRALPPQRGDEAELFERYGERLVRLVRSRTGGSQQMAEDACSFAWIQLLRYQPERDSVFAWLRVVATREAVRLLKGQLRNAALDEDPVESPGAYVDKRADLQLAVDAHEAMAELARLTSQQVRIFSLHIAGLTYDEICAATGYSWRQVDRHMQRARAHVRARRPDGGQSSATGGVGQ
jgi:RNA polymerase sigma factor (sigma-70 family)